MKKLTQRGLSWLLILALSISLLSGLSIVVSAEPGDVYNWGVRGEIAAELSSAAKAFYSGNNTYAKLSQLPGSSDWESETAVPGSQLYIALHDLMESNHTSPTNYDELRYQYIYTDVEQGSAENTTNPISSFYSGQDLGPDWDGSTWNREHVWPQSKALTDKDAYKDELCNTDMMMIRPTASNENSSHGNKAYGESSGYYNPVNSSYDLRGDVARILLYGYVRWIDGETGSEHGTHQSRMWSVDSYDTGVMENKDILLKWMAADPVDTWEMGRNDAVQSITGTRNVFVDYPELAFLLFNEEIPSDLITPSNNTIGEKTAARFMENGQDNGASITAQAGAEITLPYNSTAVADGYAFVGWVSEEVGKTTSMPGTLYKAGDKYTMPEGGTTFYALYTTFEGSAVLTNTLASGDTVMILSGSNALSQEVINSSYKGYVEVSVTGTSALPHVDALWTVTASGSGYTLANAAGQMLSNADSGNTLPYDAAYCVWTVETAEAPDSVYILNSDTGRYISWSDKYQNFSAYATDYSGYSAAGAAMQIYRVSGSVYYATTTPKATAYTVSFHVPAGHGLTAPADQDCTKLGITLPSAQAPAGYSFLGWVTEDVDNASAAPAEIYMAGDTFTTDAAITLKALYTTGDSAWNLVTDAAQLQEGVRVVIVATEYTVALSTNQKANNRGQADVLKEGTTVTWDGHEVQELTLEKGLLENTWAFNTGSGYLAANGPGKNNYLRTTAELDNFGSFTVEIDSTGISTIKGQGGNERNWMRYNASSSLFACYGSGQKDISLYIMSGSKVWTTVIPAAGHSHSYTVSGYDADTHWMACECGEIDTASVESHTGGTATCTEKAVCDGCGQSYGSTAVHSYTVRNANLDTHWYQCSVCKAVDESTRQPHSFETWGSDLFDHWKFCQCGVIDDASKVEHSEDDVLHWEHDEEKHWGDCICGGVMFMPANHSGGTATCTAKAVCETCGQEYGSLGAHVNAVHTEAVPATHTADGNAEYWYCPDCDQYLTGNTADAEILSPDDLLIHSLGHQRAQLIEGIPATHTADGQAAYYYCSVCDANFFGTEPDADKIEDLNELVIPATGHQRAEFHPAIPATHTEDGRAAYYHCSVCDANFFGTEANADKIEDLNELVIPATGHIRAEKVEAQPATHTAHGTIEHWYCADCGKYYTDRTSDAEEIPAGELVIQSLGHERAEYHPAVKATATEDGNVAYWYCSVCGKNYDGKAWDAKVIADVVIPATGTEKHGDALLLVLPALLMLLSLTGLVVVMYTMPSRKRQTRR